VRCFAIKLAQSRPQERTRRAGLNSRKLRQSRLELRHVLKKGEDRRVFCTSRKIELHTSTLSHICHTLNTLWLSLLATLPRNHTTLQREELQAREETPSRGKAITDVNTCIYMAIYISVFTETHVIDPDIFTAIYTLTFSSLDKKLQMIGQ